MRRIFITMSALLFSNVLLAKQSQNLGDKINSFFEPIVEVIGKVIFWDPISALGIDLDVSIPIVVVWLVFGALFIVGPNIEISGTEVQNFGLGALDALPIGIVVWVIGIALGGTTGYAINPARDFGPRLMYQMLPRKNKNADWSYSWVPIIGPLTGGTIAGLAYTLLVL